MTLQEAGPIATPASGALRGSWERELAVFRGVPYAVPPVGERRWRPAKPLPAWSGVRDATSDGPVCPQPRSGPVVDLMGDQIRAASMSEDCLTLTIWSPGLDERRRPVLVWIHGGGFIGGAGSWDVYSGANLARHGDVVVVAINYRLGPFGYLYVDGDDPTGGNLWLSDQRRALEWVVANISAFGGDPTQIVVGGQSGGAWSTMALLGMPDPPPVRGAVLLSAPGSLRPRDRTESIAFTARYAEALGGGELRAVDAESLVAATARLRPKPGRFATVLPPYMPTAHDPLVTEDVPARFADRAGIDVLIGWTGDEMGFFLAQDPAAVGCTPQQVVARMRETFGTHASDAYGVYGDGGRTPYEVLRAYTSDELFRMPALSLARGLAERGRRVWTYELAVESPAFDGLAGAAHCVDIPFAFDLLDTWHASGSRLLAGMNTAANQVLADRLHAGLIAFIRDGDPATRATPWRPAAGGEIPTMRFGPHAAESPVAPQLVEIWREAAASAT
ncbi:carboxylesterase/lipase family protein [Spongiactinospora rosea]|uniref:Carboxylic ester hydrolase n=1 Tax=Spongiactinospora rosea TaxID=2248750 RepID=A0A366M3J8_9ACTN|nr:carboxylesterase family protein [Spongiactinospora rosea]RBQ20617.1 carboxylesterase/lipase family protein [Spongiactinospora rosea]